MLSDIEGVDDPSRKAAEKFCVDYDPLEYLLICIIDFYKIPRSERRVRLKNAYENLTGNIRNRVDEPDSEISQAMFEYYRLEYENYRNQLNEENGGPAVNSKEDEKLYSNKTDNKLAENASICFDNIDGNLQEYIYKRARGTYNNSLIKENPGLYCAALRARHQYYDQAKEREFYEDMRKIAEILGRYGVGLNLKRPFWRLET